MSGKRLLGLLAFGGLICLLASCGSPSLQSTPTAPAPAQPADALIRFRGDYFSTAGECGYCHTGMKDASGRDISIDSDWRSSMMANASRDPYYRASVRSEVLAHPGQQAAIEKKCAVCHLGMAFTTARLNQEPVAMLPEQGFLSADHPLHALALDGVSCTMCHQILGSNLGSIESFSGGYIVDEETPRGQRDIFGRFAVDAALANVMSAAAGFDPVQGDAVQQAELCAVCHNLFTPYIDDQGQFSDELFPEQTPELEWRHSAYADAASCQACHMPVAEGATYIANTGGPPREPFFQHQFIGGNAYMINLISASPAELKVSAEPAHFKASIEETRANLSQRTADLEVQAEMISGEAMIEVSILPRVGHKFPTSYPSRRAWLHLTLKDANGAVIFESGGFDSNGAISGNDNDEDPARFEPHYREITSPGQVQIYEAIISDPDGEVTTTLLRGKAYLKDNRLLPAGFDKQSAPAAIAVIGEAAGDEDFAAGGDKILYRIDLGNAQGPFSLQVELLFQSISFRWAEKFRGEDNPEGREFYGYANKIDNLPVTVASKTISLP